MRNVTTIVQAYLECALWSSTDFDGTPLDDEKYEGVSISEKMWADAKQTCESFLRDVEDNGIDASWWEDGQIGHDLWLTQNGHGAGFWDRGQGETGKKLSEIAECIGSSEVYENDGEWHLQ
jgi:hypothetical protein